MSNQKPAHLTINGKPLCVCEGHCGGLLNRATYTHRGKELRMTCDFRSTARARSAWREIVKHRYWKTVRVMQGGCPA